MATLKVFRTSIGFHDAYVAAASKKAALRAWGTDKDLFARGSAELVTDATLTKEPLANPGVVFKRSRGTAAEQIAALPKNEHSAAKRVPRVSAPKPAIRVKPRPDRSALAEAEDVIAQFKDRQIGEIKTVDDKIAELQRQRRSLEQKQAVELGKLEKGRASLDKSYQRAIDKWRQ